MPVNGFPNRNLEVSQNVWGWRTAILRAAGKLINVTVRDGLGQIDRSSLCRHIRDISKHIF
jgi:hypothetical protein